MTRWLRLQAAAAAVAAALIATVLPLCARADAPPSFGHAIVATDAAGEPMLRVDGKPFFFLGGAFFYERIPRARWREAMLRMREIGANTLDLYVPWNWHELADGDFDFDGRTSPRRDLREVLRLGRELGFFFVVRPGPVIRNEWRNGGYPAWLLQRPEYGMPLHDVLEGRYPATATLQNAHSDDAAAEWMRNATHLRYAERWLHRALDEFRPVADRVLAVQLDDDQGAYLDNDTYPAPHLHAYLQWLQAQVRDVVGPLTPTFINTFEMKVPSSSPVWAMGNWYQSDAYAIGEHDRAELAFATATLRTQRGVPLAYSEFQAGWLAGPEDPQPRPADPTNTSLALGELAGWGLKGLIDFPLHDTLAPFGWEAPFSNALYSWDAAFDLSLDPHPEQRDTGDTMTRWFTTRRVFGALRFYGAALEEAQRVASVAVLYDGRRDAFAAAGALKADLAACRARGIACEVIDPLAVDDRRLASFRAVVIRSETYAALASRARRMRVRVVPALDALGDVAGVPDATIVRGPHGTFAVVENWSDRPREIDPRTLGASFAGLAGFVIGPREARIVAANVDLAFLSPRYRAGDRLASSCAFDGQNEDGVPVFTGTYPDRTGMTPSGTLCTVVTKLAGATTVAALRGGQTALLGAEPRVPATASDRITVAGIPLAPRSRFVASHPAPPSVVGARAYREDVFEDGARDVVLANDRVRAIIVPDGGARVVAFGAVDTVANVFDATGALRDDVLVQPPPSTTDRIAKYTHGYPAGTFNRPYASCTFGDARAAGTYLAYDAPDVVPAGARFERVLSLAADTDRLIADERLTPHGSGDGQQPVSLSAIAARGAFLDDGTTRSPSGRPATVNPVGGGVSFWSAASNTGVDVLSVAWPPGDVQAAGWTPARSNGTLRVVFTRDGWRRLVFRQFHARSEATAKVQVEAERAWAAANAAPAKDGEVAKRYTQSPQKRPSESSCGFESHLPQ